MSKVVNNKHFHKGSKPHKNNNLSQSNMKKHNKKHTHFQQQILIDLKAHTIQELYDMAEAQFFTLTQQNKNDKWNQFITKKGTKKDKITFVAAQIVKRPQTSLQQFELLAKWTLDGNPHFALPACQALSNIYIQHVFVEKPQLRIFLDSVQEHIKNNKKDSKVLKGDLVGFYLQHHIKHFYGQLIKGLSILLESTITHIKKSTIQMLASLSRFKQLRRLILSTLVNKFGDNDMQVVNQVSKNLKIQFYDDLQASEVLLQECQAFLFRENLAQKSQFYVINFLNNINLKYFSEKSLTKLFDLFFHFFSKLMDKQQQEKSISSRLFLNSIKGLNKIFGFLKTSHKQTLQSVETKVQSVYKTFHLTKNTKAKVQLLLFLFQSCTNIKGSITDRFYRVVYEFLNTNEIIHCSIVQMFFDLLLITMKEDQNINRVLAFIKRLLQLCFEAQSNFIATCLILINKVIMEKESLQIMLKQKQNQLEEQDQPTNQQNHVNGQEKALPYDMNKRQPLFAGAQKTNLWELMVFKNHYHPTVRKFTQHILKNEQIPYAGQNPLLELSLTSFIEKMSLRKEKKSDAWKLKVKRNLEKIRTSKYESLLDKPLDTFKEDEEFIKKYLQKRQTIHKNRKNLIKADDIQDYADQVIQRQMDRLQPKEDDWNDDLSISQQDLEDDELLEDIGDEEMDDVMKPERDHDDEDEDLEGDQINIGGEDQFEDEEFGAEGQIDDEEDFGGSEEYLDDIDGDNGEYEDYEEGMDSEMQGDSEEMMEDSKQFEDVFDQIGGEDEYDLKDRKKNKKKPINKMKMGKKNKKIKQSAQKKSNYKKIKKNFKTKGKRH